MNKEPKSICEKHNLEVCEDCMRNGVWTFPDKAPDDILAETEYKIMAAIGNLDGEQMTNENGELFIKYIDIQNALSQIIIPAVSQLLLSTRAEAREETIKDLKEIMNRCKTERGLGTALSNYIVGLSKKEI